ncbi:pectate lyase superfamily protein-domain-containing protein [Rhypophila decipiens]|uniref:Pectate lyase superfamily protein-domain-containing protein n=1 Tax=Rhypophila decipiens TaxID=261697 RepID=A0AAN6YDI8_9PEZI|nr:pectate lyase superfamily protein-domain-containing protein [Rhypophila decipiens]
MLRGAAALGAIVLSHCVSGAPGSVMTSTSSKASAPTLTYPGGAPITIPGGGAIPAGYTPSPPVPPPAYMVDNQNNYFDTAPDKFDPGMLEVPGLVQVNSSMAFERDAGASTLEDRQATGSSYWLANMGHGTFPYAPSGYAAWRNVKAYGAVGDGVTDDTGAINAAITDGDRCGLDCGSTTARGAIIFFPPGTYMVSKPIIQYYFTQFIGDPSGSKPTIKGMPTFEGIALIDTDPYIPGGNGAQWYINQNQFFRQIRNFVIDLTAMPNENQSGDQAYVPTGIHCTAVGLFTENGSGGFMSDLTFFGGNIAMRVGSQQFTARRITITLSAIAVSHIWNWGWTWQDININLAYIAFACNNFGGYGAQGTGSLTILDSHFNNVPYAITVNSNAAQRPAITIENLVVEGNTPSIVLVDGGETILAGTTGGAVTIGSWAMGRRYTNIDGSGSSVTGPINPRPNKPAALLDSSGNIFTRSKPQYENHGTGSFVSVADFGAVGDGTGDQSAAINAALAGANGRILFLPTGVYLVASTIHVPVGSVIVGEHWPQIMGYGDFFQDPNDPKPVWKVGNPGDVGNIEITDMMFNVRAPAAGAVVVEWNVKAASQGSAAMWDSHVRIGGSIGSNLQAKDCPWGSDVDPNCFAAAMMMHITPGASGYFENNWLWTADHDLDIVEQTRCNIFVARGLLVETTEPVWLWGGASEHAVLYQYNFHHASNNFIAHMQTESPYFQPTPDALGVWQPGAYESDPLFEDCDPSSPTCTLSWALMVRHSTDMLVYGAGLYSWFRSYTQDCLIPEDCQQRLIQTDYSQGLWFFSIYTKGALEVASPLGGIPAVRQSENRNGFLTAVSAWLPISLTGANIGGVQAVAKNPSPTNALPVPALVSACGNIQTGQTMTLSAACASAIAALPTSGSQNQPPGPENCHQVCDIFRLITGTCCGRGGSAGFAIQILPGSPLPAPMPITSGFSNPTATLVITGVDQTGSPTTSTLQPGQTLDPSDTDDDDGDGWFLALLLLPLGFIPVLFGSLAPLIIPPPIDLPDIEGTSYLFITGVTDDGSWAEIPFVDPPDPLVPVVPPPDTGDDPLPTNPDPDPTFDVIIPDGVGVDCHTDVLQTDLFPCYADAWNSLPFSTSQTYDWNNFNCLSSGGVSIPDNNNNNNNRLKSRHNSSNNNNSSAETETEPNKHAAALLSKRERHNGAYCTLATSGECSLVLGYLTLNNANSGFFQFTGQGLQDFLLAAQNTCGGEGPGSVAGLISANPTMNDYPFPFCLVRKGMEAGCGNRSGNPP